jgi:hypothetical protein
LTDEKRGHHGECHLRSWVRDRQGKKTAVPMSAKRLGKQSSFALAGFVTISSLAGVTPPSVASIETESNVTSCRDEDERPRQNQQKLKFHCVFP